MATLTTTSKTKRPASRTVGAPRGYSELKTYYPTLRGRRELLGVVANTLASWDRAQATRISNRHSESVSNLLWTVQRLQEILGSAEFAAKFLIEPQPLLGGVIPAAVIRHQGRPVAEAFVETIATIQPIVQKSLLERVLNDEKLWAGFDAKLSDAAHRRKEQALAAIAEHRAHHGKASALG